MDTEHMPKHSFLLLNLLLIAYAIALAMMIHQGLDIFALRDFMAQYTYLFIALIVGNTLLSFFFKGNKYSRSMTIVSCVLGVLLYHYGYDYFLPY